MGIKAIADAIARGSLSSINLYSNKIGSEGAKVLAPAIRDSHSLSSINLYNNQIGSEGAKVLAPAIRDSHSLTAVDLRFNGHLNDDEKHLVRESVNVKDRVGFVLKL